MVRYQTRTSDDIEPTRPPTRIEYDRAGQEDFKRRSSFDGEERTTHVGSGDSSRFSSPAYSRA